MSFLSSILTTLNKLSHNYIIDQYLYKIFNATPHFFAHDSPHLWLLLSYFFPLRLDSTNSFFFHEDCNVTFLVHIIYIEHVVSYLHNCLVFVLKSQHNSPLLCTWFPTCLWFPLSYFFSLRLGPTNFFVFHVDCNVIFVVHIRNIEHVVS